MLPPKALLVPLITRFTGGKISSDAIGKAYDKAKEIIDSSGGSMSKALRSAGITNETIDAAKYKIMQNKSAKEILSALESFGISSSVASQAESIVRDALGSGTSDKDTTPLPSSENQWHTREAPTTQAVDVLARFRGLL